MKLGKLLLNVKKIGIILKSPKSNEKIRFLRFNYAWYSYYKKKYKKYLYELPVYSDEHEYSKTVWWCWMQGEENAPDLYRANLNSLRKNLSDRDIQVITKNNYYNYVTLPEYIIEKYDKGLITHTHFSDILRAQLLIEHGGTWIDASVLCTSYNKSFFDRDLFMFKNYMRNDNSMEISSWFITAEKNNPILRTTQDLIFKYWDTHDYLENYYLFHILFTISCEKYSLNWKKVSTFSNIPPHILQFELLDDYNEERYAEIVEMSSVHKLTMRENVKISDSMIRKNKRMIDYIIIKYMAGEPDLK